MLDDHSFGERFIAGERPAKWDHVFASIQSIHRHIEQLDPTQFDVVIVDEFHHAEADTYIKLLKHLKPKVLVGLTATPERADNKDDPPLVRRAHRVRDAAVGGARPGPALLRSTTSVSGTGPTSAASASSAAGT